MFWFKVKKNGQHCPWAFGPFQAQAEAESQQSRWLASNEGNNDPGEIVETNDPNYSATLPVAIAKVGSPEGDWIVYSDGSRVLEA